MQRPAWGTRLETHRKANMKGPEQATGDPLPRGRQRKEAAEAVSACWPVSGLTRTRTTFPEDDASSGMCTRADAAYKQHRTSYRCGGSAVSVRVKGRLPSASRLTVEARTPSRAPTTWI